MGISCHKRQDSTIYQVQAPLDPAISSLPTTSLPSTIFDTFNNFLFQRHAPSLAQE
jgi:hypothetical protein